MLAYELDLPIGLNVPLTVLSAALAVSFTFVALACDMVWERYRRMQHHRGSDTPRREVIRTPPGGSPLLEMSGKPGGRMARNRPSQILVNGLVATVEVRSEPTYTQSHGFGNSKANGLTISASAHETSHKIDPPAAKTLYVPETGEPFPSSRLQDEDSDNVSVDEDDVDSERNSFDEFGASNQPLLSRRSSAVTESDASTFGLGNMMSLRNYKQGSLQAKNAFVAMARMLYLGCTLRNFLKGLVWSLAIDSMHYLGLLALRIPGGYVKVNVPLVILSAVISLVVLVVGCILMSQMETRLSQQFLFSVVATAGVAAMHFTGMAATTVYSSQSPSNTQGYPPALAAAIGTIALITCLSANYLLAHSATVARNKLAEVVQTRRKLWAAIAQKENAEAAARARSEFIASASHEIRTPLHQLQGYGDLLSQTELTEEGRLLLYAIQHATRSLSLITSNVLDWSRLEKGEAPCRPVAVDIRLVCESIVNLLPNREDEVQAELMIAVAPTVPQSLLLDETYVHRILMNLLSNAIKFTSTGYVLLLIEMQGEKMVTTVKDTGSGIPESFVPDLFEPFKQAQTRGAQRGTGLGLSIIKQLLQKMQGTIDVSSKHRQPDGKNGSVFVVKIPTEVASSAPSKCSETNLKGSIAIFPTLSEDTTEGLRMAWETYGFEVTTPTDANGLSKNVTHVWATIPFLRNNLEIMKQLIQRTNLLVLVPYDSSDILAEVPGVASTPHFFALQRPLIWHRILQTLENVAHNRSRGSIDKTVRFAVEVNVMGTSGNVTTAETSKKQTILLVEDNKINQKLGIKMLNALGYHVITADDGQEAIDCMLEHDESIDAVLMDQSMPRKDGLTATSEIRAMEEDGTLKRRRPIIAVTAVAGPQAELMCRDAGTDDFLPKPLSLARLGQSLRHHLHLTK